MHLKADYIFFFSKEVGSLLTLTVLFVHVLLVVPADKAVFLLCDMFSQQVA